MTDSLFEAVALCSKELMNTVSLRRSSLCWRRKTA